MNGWNTIKEVRTDLSEALKLAKGGDVLTANARMRRARKLLTKYFQEAQPPGYGFEAETLTS